MTTLKAIAIYLGLVVLIFGGLYGCGSLLRNVGLYKTTPSNIEAGVQTFLVGLLVTLIIFVVIVAPISLIREGMKK
jgi:hypothetical protein